MSTLRYTIDWYCTCTWQYIDWTATIRHQTIAAWPYNTQFIFKLYVVYVTYTALFDGSEGNKNHEGCMSKQLTACRYEKCIQICSITLDHYVQCYFQIDCHYPHSTYTMLETGKHEWYIHAHYHNLSWDNNLFDPTIKRYINLSSTEVTKGLNK